MAALREILAHFGVEVSGEAAIERLGQKLDISAEKAKQLLGAMGRLAGAGAVAAGAAHFTHEMAEQADALGDTAERLGISTDALQAWGYAAQLSGSSAEEFQGALGMLQRSLANAEGGGKEQRKALRDLGVAYEDASGQARPMEDVLADIAEGVSRISDPNKQAAAAMRLFGRQGGRLLPLLRRGRAGVAALREEFEALGGGLSAEFIAASSRYADSFDKLNVMWISAKGAIAENLLPALQWLSDAMRTGGQWVLSFTANSNILKAAIVVLSGVLLYTAVPAALALVTAFAPLIATTLAWVIGIGIAILVLDDLITYIKGGHSVIGDFLDAMTGLVTATEWWKTLGKAIDAVAEKLEEARKFWTDLFGDSRATVTTQGFDARTATDGGRRANSVEAQTLGMARVFAGAPGAHPAVREAPASRNAAAQTSIQTALTINVPPGTHREQLDAMRRVAEDVLAQRNAQAEQALSREAVNG